jgi:hypothetical protein
LEEEQTAERLRKPEGGTYREMGIPGASGLLQLESRRGNETPGEAIAGRKSGSREATGETAAP